MSAPRVFEFEIGAGIRYWVGATSLRSACEFIWSVFEDEGSVDDVEELASISIDVVAEKRASEIMIRDDDVAGPSRVRTATEILRTTDTYPILIGCSEY